MLNDPIRVLLKFSSLYFALSTVWIYFFRGGDRIQYFDVYFILLTLFLSLISFLKQENKSSDLNFFRANKSLKKTDLLVWAMFMLFAIGYRYYFLHLYPMWRDELEEANLARLTFPVFGCSLQSQPPLSCVLTNLGENIFGATEWGLRFHVVLGSLLSYGLFTWIVLQISLLTGVSVWFGFMGSLLYLLHPLITQYSYEVRPFGLAFYATLLLTGAVFRFLIHKNGLKFIFLSAVFLLLSIGLQSAFLLAAMFVSAILLFVWSKEKYFLYLACAIFSGVLFYLPLQIFIFKISPITQVVDSLNIKGLEKGLRSLLSLKTYEFILLHIGSLIFLPLISAIVFWIFKKTNHIKFKNLEHKLVLNFSILLMISFYIFYFVLPVYFIGFVKSMLVSRYILIALPLGVVASIGFWYLLISEIKNKILGYGISVLIAILVLTIWIIPYVTFKYPKNFDQRVLFEWVNNRLNKRDFVIMMCLPKAHGYCFSVAERMKAADVYLDKRKSSFVINKDAPALSFFKLINSGEEFDKLYVLMERFGSIPLDFSYLGLDRLEGVELYHIENESALVFSGGREKILKNWYQFIQQLEVAHGEENTTLLEYLMQKAILDRDEKSFMELMDRWIKSDKYDLMKNYSRNGLYIETTKEIFGDQK